MASTYSTNLQTQLIASGEQAGTWGSTTNTNLGTLMEQAIASYVIQAMASTADVTLSIVDGYDGNNNQTPTIYTPGTTGTPVSARNMYIECTGTMAQANSLIVPTNKKLYFIYNNTDGGFAITVKVISKTGVSVPNGKKMLLVNNGTDIVDAINYFSSLAITASTITVSGTATLNGDLNIGSAGTVTAASTTDIDASTAADAIRVTVSGTTTITSFGSTATLGTVKILTFASATPITYNATSLILPGAASMTMSVGDVLTMVSLGSGNWTFLAYQPSAITSTVIQNQTYTAFTTGGTSTAFTLATVPALAALATNQRLNVILNAAPGASPTLAVSGLTAKSFKYYDSTGTKQFITSAVAPSGWQSDIIYDGTDWVMQKIVSPDISTTNSFSAAQRGNVTALTSAATVAVDMSLANNFSLTLATNATLGLPTNRVAGQSGAITITQDATGSRTLAYNSFWKFAGGTDPTLTTTANANDVLVYYVNTTSFATCSLLKDVK